MGHTLPFGALTLHLTLYGARARVPQRPKRCGNGGYHRYDGACQVAAFAERVKRVEVASEDALRRCFGPFRSVSQLLLAPLLCLRLHHMPVRTAAMHTPASITLGTHGVHTPAIARAFLMTTILFLTAALLYDTQDWRGNGCTGHRRRRRAVPGGALLF